MPSMPLCDICREPLGDTTYEVSYSRPAAGGVEGAPLVARAFARHMQFCDPCGARFRKVLAHERIVATALKPPEAS
ncbi:MAG: hypothetical protein V3R95_10320 [Dehalococcoidia bacterium]